MGIFLIKCTCLYFLVNQLQSPLRAMQFVKLFSIKCRDVKMSSCWQRMLERTGSNHVHVEQDAATSDCDEIEDSTDCDKKFLLINKR